TFIATQCECWATTGCVASAPVHSPGNDSESRQPPAPSSIIRTTISWALQPSPAWPPAFSSWRFWRWYSVGRHCVLGGKRIRRSRNGPVLRSYLRSSVSPMPPFCSRQRQFGIGLEPPRSSDDLNRPTHEDRGHHSHLPEAAFSRLRRRFVANAVAC